MAAMIFRQSCVLFGYKGYYGLLVIGIECLKLIGEWSILCLCPMKIQMDSCKWTSSRGPKARRQATRTATKTREGVTERSADRRAARTVAFEHRTVLQSVLSFLIYLFSMQNKEVPQEQQSFMGAEYRYACFAERHAPSCSLLADFLAVARQEFPRAFKVNAFACNGLKYGPSCYAAASDYIFATYSIWYKRPFYSKAFDYFSYGCDVCKHADSCYRKGQMMIQPKGTYRGVKSNPQKGMEILEEACDKGSFNACHEASVHLLTGKIPGVKADYRKAFLLSKTACEFGYHADACHNLASMYEHGIATQKNLKTAKQIRDKVAARAAGT